MTQSTFSRGEDELLFDGDLALSLEEADVIHPKLIVGSERAVASELETEWAAQGASIPVIRLPR